MVQNSNKPAHVRYDSASTESADRSVPVVDVILLTASAIANQHGGPQYRWRSGVTTARRQREAMRRYAHLWWIAETDAARMVP